MRCGLLFLNLRWVYPVLFVGKEVVNALQGVFLWGLAGSLLDARQSKRLFPLFIAGGLAGSMLGSFSMPLLIKVFSAEAMLVGWGLALGITAWPCYTLIQRNRHSLEAQTSISDKQTGIAGLTEEIKIGYRYVRLSSLLRWSAFASLLFSVLWFALLLPFSRLVQQPIPRCRPAGFLFWPFPGCLDSSSPACLTLAHEPLIQPHRSDQYPGHLPVGIRTGLYLPFWQFTQVSADRNRSLYADFLWSKPGRNSLASILQCHPFLVARPGVCFY